MRMFVMFDLPTDTSEERREYRRFRKFLIINGYVMFQYSIYTKIILNHSAMQLHKAKLMKQIPQHGQIDVMLVTEKQFATIESFGNEALFTNPVLRIDRLIEL
ncbi:CRISPR-associated endonuclease Cas2 [Paenibacillus sp. CMAA1364]